MDNFLLFLVLMLSQLVDAGLAAVVPLAMASPLDVVEIFFDSILVDDPEQGSESEAGSCGLLEET